MAAAFYVFGAAHDGALLGRWTQIRLSATNHPWSRKIPKLQSTSSTFVLRQPSRQSRGLKASNCFFPHPRRNATLIHSHPTPRTREGFCSWN